MHVVRALALTTALVVALSAVATAASLPVNQRFADGRSRISLLTRSGGKGYVTGRTHCGRLADRRVRIAGGKISTPKGARYRISGVVTSRSTLRLTVRRGTCTAAFTLRRVSKPQ